MIMGRSYFATAFSLAGRLTAFMGMSSLGEEQRSIECYDAVADR
jgi:hypothetical protein